MSFISELFVASTSAAALLFTVLGIVSILQERKQYFDPDMLQECRTAFWLFFAVAAASLVFFLIEEMTRLGFSFGSIRTEWAALFWLVCELVLSGMFLVGLVYLARAIRELLRRLAEALAEGRSPYGTA